MPSSTPAACPRPPPSSADADAGAAVGAADADAAAAAVGAAVAVTVGCGIGAAPSPVRLLDGGNPPAGRGVAGGAVVAAAGGDAAPPPGPWANVGVAVTEQTLVAGRASAGAACAALELVSPRPVRPLAVCSTGVGMVNRQRAKGFQHVDFRQIRHDTSVFARRCHDTIEIKNNGF